MKPCKIKNPFSVQKKKTIEETKHGSEFVRFRFPAGTTFKRQSDEPLPCFLAEEVIKIWNLRYVNKQDASGVMLGSPTTRMIIFLIGDAL